MYDLCVIGGGAAGVTAAISAAKNGLSTIIIEKNEKICKKLYATGNGKCNITNVNINISYYNSSCDYLDKFLENHINKSTYSEIKDFLCSIGIFIHEENGYSYPLSNQASSVVWAISDKLQEYNVKILVKTSILNISYQCNEYLISTNSEQLLAKKIILACGSNAYPKLGGSMSGYYLAKNLGHTIKPIRPALTGLICEGDFSLLSGIRVKAAAKLLHNTDVLQEEIGELQLTNYGLSGIMIFNLSSKAGTLLMHNQDIKIAVDLLPELSLSELEANQSSNINRSINGYLNSYVNDKIVSYFCEKKGIQKKKLSSISKKEFSDLIEAMKNWTLHPTALNNYDNAQVCAGGVDLSEIYADDFSSKINKNLYIIGEMLDIDGVCGGYNLTFAIKSGIIAGESVSK